MAYALVTGQFAKVAPSGVASINVVLPNNPATGNLVIVTFGTNSGAGTFSCQDSAGTPNVYSLTSKTPFIDAGDGIAVGIFYLIATATATKTITVTFPAVCSGDVFAAEFSGGATSSIFENDATNRSVGVTSVVLPTYTTINDNDLLVAMAAPTTAITSINAPWTAWPTGIGANGGASEYLIQTTQGAQAVAFSCTSGNVAAIMAAFKALPPIIPLRPGVFTDSEIFQVQSRVLVY
jgi:hypothetical protein